MSRKKRPKRPSPTDKSPKENFPPEDAGRNLRSFLEGCKQPLSVSDLDGQHVEELLRMLVRYARWVTSKMDPWDLAHETLVELFKKRYPGIKTPSALPSYAFTILRRKAIRQYHESRRLPMRQLGDGWQCEIPESPSDNTLDDMITLLGTNHGRVIQLKLQGFTLREIAKEMGISKTAAGEYFKEAKQTLRRTLGSWR